MHIIVLAGCAYLGICMGDAYAEYRAAHPVAPRPEPSAEERAGREGILYSAVTFVTIFALRWAMWHFGGV